MSIVESFYEKYSARFIAPFTRRHSGIYFVDKGRLSANNSNSNNNNNNFLELSFP